MTQYRPYRNGDSPALARLWNRGATARVVARPLTTHEFDAQVVGGPNFEASGLIVAARDGAPIGFAHAGFGPDTPVGKPLHLAHGMGSVAMLVVDAEVDEPGLAATLLEHAEGYLRQRGASVLYGGGAHPLNPFYWGIYGGSECAGILASDVPFRQAVEARGYLPCAGTVLLEADLSRPDSRDPRAVLTRRLTRVEVNEDALSPTWWETLALGNFHPTVYRLLTKADSTELARATVWNMSWFGRLDNRSRAGLIDVFVPPEHRRKGHARFLVQEVLRQSREQAVAAVAVQTDATNIAALALYAALGFEEIDRATVYRLPSSPG